MGPVRVVTCDDHEIFLNGLKLIIETIPKYKVVAQYLSGKDLLTNIGTTPFDILILDINLPDRNGIDILKQLRALSHNGKIIMLSMHMDNTMVMRALHGGADGYLHKGSSNKDIFKAMEYVLENKIYLAAEPNQHAIKRAIDVHLEQRAPHENLSDRELEVLIMLGQGATNQEISQKLQLSPKTIGTYKHRLQKKLDLKKSIELFEYVKDYNLA